LVWGRNREKKGQTATQSGTNGGGYEKEVCWLKQIGNGQGPMVKLKGEDRAPNTALTTETDQRPRREGERKSISGKGGANLSCGHRREFCGDWKERAGT